MLNGFNRSVDRLVELAVAFLFMAVVAVGGLQVFCRFVLDAPLGWSEEFQIYGHVWIVFLTIPIAYNRGSHILVTMLLDRFPAGLRRGVVIGVDLMWLWLGLSIGLFTMRLVRVAAFQRSPAMEIPMSYVYMGMIAGGAYLSWIALRKLVGHLRGGNERPVDTGDAHL